MNKINKYLLSLMLIATSVGSAVAQEETVHKQHQHVLQFVDGDDMFYTLYKNKYASRKEVFTLSKNNTTAQNQFYELVKKHKTLLEQGKMYFLLESYATSANTTQSSQEIARIQRNRVKSDLIMNAGATEAMFVTDRVVYNTEAYGKDKLRNVIVITIPAPVDRIATIAGEEKANVVRQYYLDMLNKTQTPVAKQKLEVKPIAEDEAVEKVVVGNGKDIMNAMEAIILAEDLAKANAKVLADEASFKAQQEANEQEQQARQQKQQEQQTRQEELERQELKKQQEQEQEEQERKQQELAEQETKETKETNETNETTSLNLPISIRINTLRWATLTPDLGVEYHINDTWSIVMHGTWTSWRWDNQNRKYAMWQVSPEVRYQLKNNFYVGAAYQIGSFDYKLAGDGKQGDYHTIGLVGGYKLALNNTFSLDFGIGAGYTHAPFEAYTIENGVRMSRGKDTRNYWGINQASVTLAWRLF